MVKTLNKKQYRILLIILFVVFSLLPCLSGQSWLDTTDFAHGCTLFIFVYLLAGYIRLYPEKIFSDRKTALLFIILPQIVIWAFVLVVCYMFNKPMLAQYLTVNSSPFIVIESLGIFIAFKSLRMKNSKLINWVASSTLAVYLIHEHPALCRVLWGGVNIQAQYEGGTLQFVFAVVFSVLAVFCICVTIDKIVEGIFLKRINNKLFSALERTEIYSYIKCAMSR